MAKDIGPEKTLIIAEKPSVAQDLLKALPEKFEKQDGYFESEHYLVSYAVGHLVAICNPKEMDDKHKSWSLDNLPILPETFQIKALPKTKTQLSTLAKLIRRKEVTKIVNACDAGREGELIFRYVLQYCSETKPVKASISRLWLQSMTKAAMEKGLSNLRSDQEMQKLFAAALCRSEADWLVGINGSRALTGYKSLKGGFFLTPCGRVQTPTLSMLVSREEARNQFVSVNYWELQGRFTSSGDEYFGKWFDPEYKKNESDENTKADRIWNEAQAKDILARCQGKPAEVTETQKPSSQSAPPLYDLTSLQREANARFGFSAKNTLGIAQALYERHKLLTYPRTDSRFLPNDYLDVAKNLMTSLQDGEFAVFAKKALKQNYVRMDKRIFDDAKISDHHAIIPTGTEPGELSEPERKIYQMVTQRFLSVFYPPARFLNTLRISKIDGEQFKTEGKVLEDAGWKEIYGVDKKEEEILSPLKANAKVVATEIVLRGDATKPPPRLNESTLLSFMESAGKYVEDEELKEALKERGLGTPATRAAVIEGLIEDKYVVREGKELIPTAKGIDLLRLLSAIGIDELVSPELTGEWEFKLTRIEKGLFTREEFMLEIRDLTKKIVTKIKAYDEDLERKQAAFKSPIPGRTFFETLSKFQSDDGKIVIRKVLGGRQMSEDEILELLTNKKIGPLTGFRSKQGRPFTALIKLTDELKVEFVFEDNNSGPDGNALDLSKQEAIGVSPVDNSKVYETLTSYVSESSVNGDTKNGLKINKVILGQSLDREHIRKMLAGEKTALIKNFQSSKTRRFFDAYLKLSKEGKIQFEFQPRVFKGRGKKPKADTAEVAEAAAE